MKDKATVEMESMEEGYLAKIVRGDGEKEIQVGEVLISYGSPLIYLLKRTFYLLFHHSLKLQERIFCFSDYW